MAFKTPPAWYVRDLRLIDPGLKVAWNNRVSRWLIHHQDGSVSLRIEHPKTRTFRDLDQRSLRKMRVNIFFTHNAIALDKYLEEDHVGLRSYLARGLNGVSDYLSGWDKND